MPYSIWRASFSLAVVAAVTTLIGAKVSGATQSFDGQWSVQVTPEGGQCDGMYVLPVEVAEGRVRYIGRAAVRAEGGIGPDGTVRVVFIMEANQLHAKGTLSSARFGVGSWISPTEGCRGT